MNENIKNKLKKVSNVLHKCWIVVSSAAILFGVIFILNFNCNYFIQKKYMTYKLNKIPNVKVVNIRGNEDLDLEEISARMTVSDTNEIVLYYLSKDVFNYPKTVYISELNDKKFIPFYANGKELGIVFNTPEDVIKNIDKLDSFFSSLKTAPELNYFCDTITKKEMYLGIKYIKGDDKHPAIDFDYGTKVEVVKCNKMDFAKTLDWKY